MFHAMRANLAKKFTDAAQTFEHVSLKTSFRSVPAVLDAIDRVFTAEAHQRGLVSADVVDGA